MIPRFIATYPDYATLNQILIELKQALPLPLKNWQDKKKMKKTLFFVLKRKKKILILFLFQKMMKKKNPIQQGQTLFHNVLRGINASQDFVIKF